MEKKLKKLFDYQKFAQNEHLEEVIKSTRTEDVVELQDDALFAAAGGQGQDNHKYDKEKN